MHGVKKKKKPTGCVHDTPTGQGASCPGHTAEASPEAYAKLILFTTQYDSLILTTVGYNVVIKVIMALNRAD